MIEPEFLELDAALFLHEQAVGTHGGTPGLKDRGLLESALGRPVNRWLYDEAATLDLFDLAASYAFGIARNHAFNDANKRTAWACCILFLKLNGVEFAAPLDAILTQMVSLATGITSEDAFAAWLREHTGIPA